MRLGIISDCIHYKNANGQVGTETHILLRQFEQLAGHFTQTTILCPFADIDDTKVITWYSADIQFIEVPNAGGESIKDKIHMLTLIPIWFKAFSKINKLSDIIYQRFPNNLNIPGFFYFYLKKKKVFATYTGTWGVYNTESLTYRLQRWLLRHAFRGPVWVYTNQNTGSSRIMPGISPSYSQAEWQEEAAQVSRRIVSLKINGLPAFRLITVGKLVNYKNQLLILRACAILKKQNFSFSLKIVGDGPMADELKTFVQQNDLGNAVEFTGKKNYSQLRELYRQADLVVQAPLVEGFGKVPIEGLFHGVVPVLSNVSMAAYMTGNEERGFLFDAGSAENLANKILEIKNKISLLPAIIDNGRSFAKQQTLQSWASEYYETISAFYK